MYFNILIHKTKQISRLFLKEKMNIPLKTALTSGLFIVQRILHIKAVCIRIPNQNLIKIANDIN